MQPGPARARSDGETTQVSLLPVPSASAPRPAFLPARIAWAVEELERACDLDAFATFEQRLAAALELDDVLGVWFDWVHRRTWCPRGRVSTRLEELVPAAAGSGRRVILSNALVEPIGPAPARMVLVLKGAPDRLFLQHTLRSIKRVAARLAPTIAPLAGSHGPVA